jgi:hypothetical protein
MLNICDVLAFLRAPTISVKDSKTVIEYWGRTGSILAFAQKVLPIFSSVILRANDLCVHINAM